ncbi:conserved hypothetical protein [Rhodopseudomonas palustris HaA2]|uniref:DUF3551 domain-containing protein n=2 Tax=Rhodopseudomonas palustris TaxID=1076 RepID=Q2J3Q3_RHOP2|nr:conserved hypothetical protein [Rhodopseudomonas palustris HaA2]
MKNRIWLVTVLAVSTLAASAASAKPYKWCIDDGISDSLQCEFTTLRECRASVSGTGGECTINPKLKFGKAKANKAAAQ